MFGLGIWEIALILVVALLVLGPEKLPKVARQLGRGMRELRKAAGEFQTNLAAADSNNDKDDDIKARKSDSEHQDQTNAQSLSTEAGKQGQLVDSKNNENI